MRTRSGYSSYSRHTGFTLVELISVILIVAILAVFAIPRFIGSDSIEPRTTQDTLIAAARRAQQLAMNKGNAAAVQFVTDNTSHRARITYNEGGPQSIDYPLPETVTVNDVTVNYDVLGNTGATTTITLAGGRNVCIETTGYAHPC